MKVLSRTKPSSWIIVEQWMSNSYLLDIKGPTMKPYSLKWGTRQGLNFFYLGLLYLVSRLAFLTICGLHTKKTPHVFDNVGFETDINQPRLRKIGLEMRLTWRTLVSKLVFPIFFPCFSFWFGLKPFGLSFKVWVSQKPPLGLELKWAKGYGNTWRRKATRVGVVYGVNNQRWHRYHITYPCVSQLYYWSDVDNWWLCPDEEIFAYPSY